MNSIFGYDAESWIISIQHGLFVDREIRRNDADQLVSKRVQTGPNRTDIVYGYNDNGGLGPVVALNFDLVFYEYDYDNRLSRVSSGQSQVLYLYDASCARIGCVHNSDSNYFVVDYMDGLKRPLAETDASGNVTRYYVWSGSRLFCHIEPAAGAVTLSPVIPMLTNFNDFDAIFFSMHSVLLVWTYESSR